MSSNSSHHKKRSSCDLSSTRDQWLDTIVREKGNYNRGGRATFVVEDVIDKSGNAKINIKLRRKGDRGTVRTFVNPLEQAYVAAREEYAAAVKENEAAKKYNAELDEVASDGGGGGGVAPPEKKEVCTLIPAKEKGFAPILNDDTVFWKQSCHPTATRLGTAGARIKEVPTGKWYKESRQWSEDLAITENNNNAQLDRMEYVELSQIFFAIMQAITEPKCLKKLRERFSTYIRTLPYQVSSRDGFALLKFALDHQAKKGFRDVDTALDDWKKAPSEVKLDHMPGDIITTLMKIKAYLDVNKEPITDHRFYRKFAECIKGSGFFKEMRDSWLTDITGKKAEDITTEYICEWGYRWDTIIERDQMVPCKHEFITALTAGCFICSSHKHGAKDCPLNVYSKKADLAKIIAIASKKGGKPTISALKASKATKKKWPTKEEKFALSVAESGCKMKKCLSKHDHQVCQYECGKCLLAGKSIAASKECKGAADGHEWGASVMNMKLAAKAGKFTKEQMISKFKSKSWIVGWCDQNNIAAMMETEINDAPFNHTQNSEVENSLAERGLEAGIMAYLSVDEPYFATPLGHG